MLTRRGTPQRRTNASSIVPATGWWESKTAEGFRGNAKAYQLDACSLATGGTYDNWPLVPEKGGLSAEANARMEIARAKRFGIDGFAFDAWAGGQNAMNLLDVFFRMRAAEIYDAVGGFLGTDGDWGNNADLIASVRAGGRTWSQPMFYQYSNKAGGILTRRGLSWLRDNWKAAIANDSRLLQFVTWNDYGEETILAPSTGGAYTVPRINAWYVEKWKTGRDPQIAKDEVHAVYRRTVGQPEPFPLQSRRLGGDLPTCLEVTTFLTAPARVQVKDYGAYDAPAGMFVKEFVLKPGRVAVRVRRGEGTDVLRSEVDGARLFRHERRTGTACATRCAAGGRLARTVHGNLHGVGDGSRGAGRWQSQGGVVPRNDAALGAGAVGAETGGNRTDCRQAEEG